MPDLAGHTPPYHTHTAHTPPHTPHLHHTHTPPHTHLHHTHTSTTHTHTTTPPPHTGDTTHSCFVVVQIWTVVSLSVLLLHQKKQRSPHWTAGHAAGPAVTYCICVGRACPLQGIGVLPPREEQRHVCIAQGSCKNGNSACTTCAHPHPPSHTLPQDCPSVTSSCTACSAYFTLCLALSV